MSSAIVTGVQTVIDDDPLMSVRKEQLDVVHADAALKVVRPVYVLDPRGRVPHGARLLKAKGTVLVCLKEAKDVPGVEVMQLPATGDNRIDLQALLTELAGRDHNEILIECGQTLAGAFVSERLVDELILYIAPKFMGDGARSLLKLPDIARMSDLVQLTIADIQQVGEDLKITATLGTS